MDAILSGEMLLHKWTKDGVMMNDSVDGWIT